MEIQMIRLQDGEQSFVYLDRQTHSGHSNCVSLRLVWCLRIGNPFRSAHLVKLVIRKQHPLTSSAALILPFVVSWLLEFADHLVTLDAEMISGARLLLKSKWCPNWLGLLLFPEFPLGKCWYLHAIFRSPSASLLGSLLLVVLLASISGGILSTY